MHVQPSSPQPEPQALAAVDLGSNSFHLLVVRPNDGELQVLDRLREMVQLGAGLNARNELSEQA
ncbi:MAG: exopolyphosphatase, partial [Gammaproteobacteria bacterium]|nr:exopolyphosphatase [Gammaproteobacteria bacterium]NIR97583.1 exopolyphosphatase [Gammaproteobacteria bacterium]NIV20166.1 exopolyphosphatase [Gammaproteobacteria bacterium]